MEKQDEMKIPKENKLTLEVTLDLITYTDKDQIINSIVLDNTFPFHQYKGKKAAYNYLHEKLGNTTDIEFLKYSKKKIPITIETGFLEKLIMED